jgi:hypothetical protein
MGIKVVLLGIVATLVAVAVAGAQTFGISVPVRSFGTEVWRDWMPTAIGVIGAIVVLIAWIANHALLFMAALGFLAAAAFIGFGIPQMLRTFGWTWFF